MRVLVTGASGQLGRSLLDLPPAGVEVSGLGRSQCDLADVEQCRAAVRAFRPDVLINAAAYTQVDKAESERDLVFRINAEAPGALAEVVREQGGRFIQLSTDFVFDGTRNDPYPPGAVTRPLNVYGASKLAGEASVQRVFGGEAVILRTAWVYSSYGTNFVRTMLRLMGSRDSVSVVADQIGSPTWARSLAKAVWAAAINPSARGILHWTDSGPVSWHGFAVAIQEQALVRGLLKQAVPIHPIAGEEYVRRVPGTVARPAFSVLETESTQQVLHMVSEPWRINLGVMLDELAS